MRKIFLIILFIFMVTNSTCFAGSSGALVSTFSIVARDADTGEILISGHIVLSDELDTEEFSARRNSAESFVVQSPAGLVVTEFRPSQPRVTTGQTEIWHVGARVRNTGGSAVRIETGKMNLDLVEPF